MVVTFIAYKRYPLYLDQPSFYAEDGTIVAKNIMEKGFWAALMTPFNGYFIWGMYLLESLGFVINALFHGGNFLNLPASLAMVSYAFWGFLCTLPVALFWHDVKHKTWLVVIGLSLAVLPMPSFNYAVFGIIGDYKYAFLFVAFLLILKRMRLASDNKWVHLLDAGIVVCAFTNVTVYLLLPFALLPYWPGRKRINKAFFTNLLRNRSFLSLLALGLLLSLQLAYVAVHGVTELPGYMQEPYEFAKTIEIFVHRTLLFPFDRILLKHLNDVWTLAICGALLVVMFWFARKEDRVVAAFGLWSSLLGTGLFVSQRTGVTQFFVNYQTSGTDHFFYAQNMIFLFGFMYVVTRYIDTAKRLRSAGVLALLLLIPLLTTLFVNDFGKNVNINRLTGDIWYATQQACQTEQGDVLSVPVYPVNAQFVTIPRGRYCTPEVTAYIPRRQPLPLTPFGGKYLPVNASHITQTFKASYNQLSGISPLFGTFGARSTSGYQLVVLDGSCKRTLRSVTFSASSIADNAYHDISFQAITDSKDKTYCFTIEPQNLEPNKPPLALLFSEPGIYPQGTARQDDVGLQEDIVFDVLYR